jgi:hypothetical protein
VRSQLAAKAFWTIPNLLLHDKPLLLSEQRALGKQVVRLLLEPGSPPQRRYRPNGFPDNITYNELQPRMLCTVCDHRGADVRTAWHVP